MKLVNPSHSGILPMLNAPSDEGHCDPVIQEIHLPAIDAEYVIHVWALVLSTMTASDEVSFHIVQGLDKRPSRVNTYRCQPVDSGNHEKPPTHIDLVREELSSSTNCCPANTGLLFCEEPDNAFRNWMNRPAQVDLLIVVARHPGRLWLLHGKDRLTQSQGASLTALMKIVSKTRPSPDCSTLSGYHIDGSESTQLLRCFFEDLWRHELVGVPAVVFPHPPVTIRSPSVFCFVTYNSQHVVHDWLSDSPPLSGALGAAWALLVSQWSGVAEVCFHLWSREQSAMPVRMAIDPETSSSDLMSCFQRQTDAPHWREWRRLPSREPSKTAIRKSLPSIHNGLVLKLDSDDAQWVGSPEDDPLALIVRCRRQHCGSGRISFDAHFDEQSVTAPVVERILRQWEHLTHQMLESPHHAIRTLCLVSPTDHASLLRWNTTVPSEERSCIHEEVQRVAREGPDREAVSAWDGTLSYTELDETSSRLAGHLHHQLRLSLGTVVPVIFEKSCWAVVATLAVLKAGCAVVCVDASYPPGRIKEMVAQVDADRVLVSPGCAGRLDGDDCETVVTLDRIRGFSHPVDQLPRVTPDHRAFVIFTSGSTGTPKGIEFPHAALLTAMKAQGRHLNMDQPGLRVLQFSSYAFDVSIYEMYTTLLHGGSICVPSESERLNHLARVIQQRSVNWAWFTPSAIQVLTPDEVPSLTTVAVGGESVPPDTAAQWAPWVTLFNGYGPAECTICTAGRIDGDRPHEAAKIIGRGVGCVSWITVADDPGRLAAVGTVGELLIEGPVVARGYLNQPSQTAAAFIPAPDWLRAFRRRQGIAPQRVYRTGDLARYQPDGTLVFVGRHDSQVKIRGQRLDLMEIEARLRQTLDPSYRVAIGLTGTLTAFIFHPAYGDHPAGPSTVLAEATSSFEAQVQACRSQLAHHLPGYMVPTTWLPLALFPLTPTSKVDRRALHRAAESLLSSDIPSPRHALCHPQSGSVEPQAQWQWVLADLTRQALQMSAPPRMDRSFVQLGGDSLAAIHLVAHARRQQFRLTVEAVLECPSLTALAEEIQRAPESPSTGAKGSLAPWTLLGISPSAQLDTRAQLGEQLCISPQAVIDAYPATPMQAGLLAMNLAHPQLYASRFCFQLPDLVDWHRLRVAWDRALGRTPILRTRLTQLGSQCVQVVVEEPVNWEECENYDQLSQRPLAFHADGGLLCRITRTVTHPPYLQLDLHHAIYDAWSLDLMLRRVEAAYREGPVATPVVRGPQDPFNLFVEHIAQQTTAQTAQFWASYCSDLRAVRFPELPTTSFMPTATKRCIYKTPLSASAPTSPYTAASMIQLAWALLLRHYTDSSDVVFGLTRTGRAASLDDIEDLVGPTIATVPMRIAVDDGRPVMALLGEIQAQGSTLTPHEQYGLQHIRRVNADTAAACDFQNLLVIQRPGSGPGDGLFAHEIDDFSGVNFGTNYALTLLCEPGPECLQLEAIFDDRVVSTAWAQRLLAQLSHLLIQVRDAASLPDKPLGALSLLSASDVACLRRWNLPGAVEVRDTVHAGIHAQALLRPAKVAICAWDGDITYGQLDDWSSCLASYLVSCGVHRGAIVGLCFEKTRWMTVAAVAVMKAGAGFVQLDPSQPTTRLGEIIAAASIPLLVCSAATRVRATALRCPILSLDDGEPWRTSLPFDWRPWADPSQVLYVVFTSGSTGRPKGVIIEHGQYRSIAAAHSRPHFIDDGTRALQVSSYAFDASLFDMLSVMLNGGTLCVPNEHDCRNDVAAAAQRFRPNWICLTPSVLKVLSPDQLPSIETIVAVGESMPVEVVQAWATRVRLLCGYGPAECSAACAAHRLPTAESNPRDLGSCYGGVFWVVNPRNHDSLVPVGAVGELVIEGPIVGRGYLDEPDKTAGAFLSHCAWLPDFRGPSPGSRLYKTGDLVTQCAESGHVRYVGRKDRQIKLRGQRIELAAIEDHVARSFPTANDVIADLVVPRGDESGKAVLVAFVRTTANGDADAPLTEPIPGQAFRSASAAAHRILRTALPVYMVPAVFVPLTRTPLTATLKTDRRQLHGLAAGWTRAELFQRGVHAAADETGETDHAPLDLNHAVTRAVHDRVWEIVGSTNAPAEDPRRGADVALAALGLDSIDAMALAAALRRDWGVRVPMAAFLRDSARISDVVQCIRAKSTAPAPVDLLAEFDHLVANSPGSTAVVQPHRRDGPPETVFVTGATGFLGTHVLRQLLQESCTRRVIALVRASDETVAQTRLVDIARTMGWWREEYATKLTAWVGDLAAVDLGLQPAQRAELRRSVHAIIHNGAVVHWGTDLATLTAPNVLSTRQLHTISREASASLVFVSTASAEHEWTAAGRAHVAQKLATAEGYTQSKFLAELVLAQAPSLVRVVRPGWIVGTADGAPSANTDDFIWRVAAAAVRAGARHSSEDQAWIPVAGATQVASVVVDGVTREHSSPVLTLNDGVSVRMWWELLETTMGVHLEIIPRAQWLQRVQQQVLETGPRHPLYAGLPFLEEANGCIGEMRYQGSAVMGEHWQQETLQSLRRSIEYLVSIGYFSTDGCSGEFGRTGLRSAAR